MELLASVLQVDKSHVSEQEKTGTTCNAYSDIKMLEKGKRIPGKPDAKYLEEFLDYPAKDVGNGAAFFDSLITCSARIILTDSRGRECYQGMRNRNAAARPQASTG